MSSWQARLVDLIVHRFSDSQALMTEMWLRFDRAFVSELPSAASLKGLAAAIVSNCEARGSVDILLSALQAESGASEPELDEICREYVVEAEDPRLWAAIDAHREHVIPKPAVPPPPPQLALDFALADDSPASSPSASQ